MLFTANTLFPNLTLYVFFGGVSSPDSDWNGLLGHSYDLTIIGMEWHILQEKQEQESATLLEKESKGAVNSQRSLN